MRLMCPSCLQMVTLPDSAAGKPTPCPLCQKPFAPPNLTGALIDSAPPPAPPTVIEQRPAPTPAAPPRAPESVEAPAAPSRSGESCCVCTIRKDVVRWIAPIALFIAFVLSFFTWQAAAPNGNPVYTQSGWMAMRGAISTDAAGDEILGRDAELEKNSGWNLWLLFYLILLIPATILAVGDLIATRIDVNIPDVFKGVWPHRGNIVAGLALLLFLLLIVPLITGFGLETAAAAAAEQKIGPAVGTTEGAAPTPKQIQARDLKRDIEIAQLGIHRTRWLCAAFWAQLIALGGILTMGWLDRRGDGPEPRIECYS